MRSRRVSGFTLIELLVTIALIATVLAIGLPNFQQAIRSNRVSTATNELMAAIALARSEAMRGKGGGHVCTSREGSGCGGDWNDGWIVWSDRDDDGAPSSDEVLRYVRAPEGLAIGASAGSGSLAAFGFDLRGRLDDGVRRGFTLQPRGCDAGLEQARTIQVAATGQIRMERQRCQ